MESTLCVLFQISRVFANPFARHISTLHSLFNVGSNDPLDTSIFQNAVSIIQQSIEHVDRPQFDMHLMNSIQNDLQKMLTGGSQSVQSF